MKFPYGVCDFYALIKQGYFYVDRTDRIPLFEEMGKNLLFLRPRRFGKSLLLSMLENYYDAAKANEFDQIFGRLKIGPHPTPLHNQYLILNWDFSAVSPMGEPEQMQRALHNHINGCIEYFSVRYRDILQAPIVRDETDALRSFQALLSAVQATPYKLYLLIDEYDNFANEVMMSGQAGSHERYKSLLYGEGALKTVFKAIKAASRGMGLDRTFITGVSPVVMSDLTSGYNIAQNIYLKPELHDVCGFEEAEILATLEHLAEIGKIAAEKIPDILALMRTMYNGYAFAYDRAPRVYNPTLVIYFLEHLHNYGTYPRRLLDTNLAMDKGKITYISRLPHGAEMVVSALNEDTPVSITELADRFGVEEMLTAVKDTAFMASLLYFFGVLTLTEQHTALGKLILRIPNLVIRKLYVERMQDLLLSDAIARDDAQRAAEIFYQTGNLQPLCDFMEQRYFTVFDNRDYRWANELTLKTALLTLLFNDTFYIMDSETPLGRTYSDLTMIVRPDMRQFELLDMLIECKYVALKDVGLTAEQTQSMSRADLLALPLVQTVLADARTSLTGYRRRMHETYGSILRLHVYSVVSIGFERVLWEELGA